MKTLGSDLNTKNNHDLFSFTQGIDVDEQLFESEIKVQKAWAMALAEAKYLELQELKDLNMCLDKISEAMRTGNFDWRVDDEDIHMNIERALTDELGVLGKKIHMGRSRNDLIATTLRLHVTKTLEDVSCLVKGLGLKIIEKSETWLDIIVPGMTHVQSGQPIRWGHAFSSHGQGLKRDLRRMDQAIKEAMYAMPLGSAAFSGTHLNLDLTKLAKDLGFLVGPENSYDSVGDRDFMLQALQAFSILAVHLSRICEESIFMSSTAVGFLKLSKDWSTGSSIMPNKRNPDVLELVRAKMARVIAANSEALMIMKSVIPSYGSDLHELKRTYFRALNELESCLPVLTSLVASLEVDMSRAQAMLGSGHILATEVANSLSQKMPFREAYQSLTTAVVDADSKNVQVHELDQWESLGSKFSYAKAVEDRNNLGGSSSKQAAKSLSVLAISFK